MDPDDLMELIKKRRSVRTFKAGEDLPDEKIMKIVEAGIWAPTGTNQQELRFFVIKDKDLIQEFAKYKNVRTAACVIIMGIDKKEYYASYSETTRNAEHKKYLPYIDTGACLMNMLLMAESLGIKALPLNISKHLFYDTAGKRNIFQRILRRLSLMAGKSMFGVMPFYGFCRKAGIDTGRFLPSSAIALGYSEAVPDIDATYGKRPVRRRSVPEHVIGIR